MKNIQDGENFAEGLCPWGFLPWWDFPGRFFSKILINNPLLMRGCKLWQGFAN